ANGSGTVTVVGTLASLNAALDGLQYLPSLDYNGTDTLTIAADDLGNTGVGGPLTDTRTVGLTITAVNDAPVLTAPGPPTTAEDTALVFATASGNALSLADVDAGAGTERLTLTVTNGTLTLGSTAGLGFSAGGNGTASMTVTGTLANLNAAL